MTINAMITMSSVLYLFSLESLDICQPKISYYRFTI